jgi:hypothetical protein
MEEGFDVTFLSDAIGAASIPEYEAAIRVNFPLIGNAVITVDEFSPPWTLRRQACSLAIRCMVLTTEKSARLKRSSKLRRKPKAT